MELVFLIVCLVIAAVLLIIVGLSKSKSKSTSNLTPEEKPGTYQDKAQPGQGFVKNIHTRINARSDAKTQHTANVATSIATEGIRTNTEAISAKLEKEALPERHEQLLAKEEAETQTILTQHNAIQTLTNNALKDGLSVDGQQRYLLDKFLSGLKVDEHRQLTDIDLENRWKEITQDLNAADLLVIAARGVINKLESELKNARIERYATHTDKNLPKPLKKQLLADKDRSIEHLEAQIRGWQERETRLDLPENQTVIGERNQTRRLTEGETEG